MLEAHQIFCLSAFKSTILARNDFTSRILEAIRGLTLALALEASSCIEARSPAAMYFIKYAHVVQNRMLDNK